MQVIRQQNRTVMPTGESPNVTLNPNMFAGEAAAAQRLAGAVQQFGGVLGDIGLKMQDAEVEREQKEFQIKVNETNQADEVFYRDNNDVVLTPEERDAKGNITKPARTSYQDQHDKSMKSLEAAASGLKYGKARKEAQQWLALNKPLLQHNTDQYIHREAVERSLGTHEAYVASILNSNQALKTDEFNSVARKNFPGGKDLTENEYKLAQIKTANDSLVKRNFLTPEQAQTIYDNAAADLHKAGVENVQGVAQQMIDAGNDIPTVQKFIDTQKLSPSDKLSQYGHATTYYNAKNLQNKQERDAIQIRMMMDMEKNKNLPATDKVTMGDGLLLELSKIQGMTREDFSAMQSKIDKFRTGADETDHPFAISKFDTMATDIWRGATTKQKFEEELTASTKLSDSDPNAINSKEYATLMKSADTELKTSQAQALSGADEMAGRALVDFKSEPEWLAAFSASTGEEKKTLSDKRKLQFEILNQYNSEMRNFLADNPKASGKEFEQFRDKKRFEYINHRAELEKNIKSNIETFNPKTNKPTRKAGESVAEYLKRTGQE